MWSHDAAFPQRCPSSPISEVGQCDGPGLAQPLGLGTDNPLLAPPVPSAEGSGLAVQLLPSGEPCDTEEPAGLLPGESRRSSAPPCSLPPSPLASSLGEPTGSHGFTQPSERRGPFDPWRWRTVGRTRGLGRHREPLQAAVGRWCWGRVRLRQSPSPVLH